MGFGKIFDDIFHGSLMADGGPLAVYVMMGFVALADQDGIIAQDVRRLYSTFGLNESCGFGTVTLDDFRGIIDQLCAPDAASNISAYGGRRLIPLANLPEIEGNRGFWLVNHAHYRRRGSTVEAVEKARKRKQRQRERESAKKAANPHSSANVTLGHGMSRPQRDTPVTPPENTPQKPPQKPPSNPHGCADVTHGHACHAIAEAEADKEEKKKDTKKKRTPAPKLPDWLDREAWALFVQHRRETGHKLTPRSAAHNLAVLEKHQADQVQIVAQAVKNGWRGLHPLRARGRQGVGADRRSAGLVGGKGESEWLP